jgi:8-oxo-dGTP pyrophosphatase MutT (NUDIX family)
MSKEWKDMTQGEKQAHNQRVMKKVCRPLSPAEVCEAVTEAEENNMSNETPKKVKAPNTVLAVSGVLLDPNGRVLLGLRSVGTGLPGLWATPGGTSEAGETINETLVREFKEEVNLHVEVWNSFPSIVEYFREADGVRVVLIFKRVTSRSSFYEAKALDGLDEIIWAYPEKVRELGTSGMLTPATKKALKWFSDEE